MAANRPDAAELAEAVHEFLSGELLGATERADLKFKLRIAINVLRTIERELKGAAVNDAVERAALQALLESDETDVDELNETLCAQIRDGAFDDNIGSLCEALEGVVLNRLGVDNPKYSTYRALRSDAV